MTDFTSLALFLNMHPIEIDFDIKELIKDQVPIKAFPEKVYGTQDRSYMYTETYRQLQSEKTRNYWKNANTERLQKARETIKKNTSKPVMADGIQYSSITECAAHYKISIEAVRKRIKSKNYNFEYMGRD